MDDKDILCLGDIALLFGIKLTYEQIIEILKTDEYLIMEACKWGVTDTVCMELFANTLTMFFINERFPESGPHTGIKQEEMREKVKKVAREKGYTPFDY